MAEEFFMFDSVDEDRVVTAADFAKYFHEILTNGVFYRNNVPSLAVSKWAGLVTNVDIGAAFVEGYMYRNTAPIALTHSVGNASFPRIDRIVIRLDRNISKRDIRVVVKQGVAASNPSPPSLERNELVYELSLAQVLVNTGANVIATVTDERLNQSLCGVVNSLAELPTDIFLADMEAFQDELDGQLNMLIQTSQTQWDAFMGSITEESPALGGMTIYVRSTTPSTPNVNDIWIDTN